MSGVFPGPRNRHELSPYSARFTVEPTTGSQVILDLTRPEDLIEAGPVSGSLVGYPYGRPVSSGFQPIEAWTMVDGRTFSQCELFRAAQSRMIRRVLWSNKPTFAINSPVLLLPHYNSQFGHFVAENLGQLLYHSIYTLALERYAGYKVVACFPSPAWRDFLTRLVPKNRFYELGSADILSQRPEFSCSVRSIPLCSWQNIALARNHVSAWLHRNRSHFANIDHPSRIFLVDTERTRVVNLPETRALLSRHGFSVFDPTETPVDLLLFRLTTADLVISESSSIFMNVMLSRSATTLVLSPAFGAESPCLSDFAGGYIYTELMRGLLRHVPCPITKETDKHPFSRRLYVDPVTLESELNRYRP